ncbi:MAG TPA: 4Fe-4S dicluster domain-containing protein [Xanthobacteraceae bacterium]|jgi:molybdopterin-containing oxidoreductase family iron-sulfur binding subunit
MRSRPAARLSDRADTCDIDRCDIDRRAALRFLGVGLTSALTSCGKPFEEIVPYVDMPERLVAGEPLKFATALSLAGFGCGVLATSIDGRPIKIEGNPRHPSSLGATDVFAEAAIMSLYDPGRSKAPRSPDGITTWDAFAGALRLQLQKEQERQGAGLRIFSNRITSPTLLRQIEDVIKQYPQARWFRYEPVSDDATLEGAKIAYGKPLVALPRIADAAVVLALDADPLGAGPRQIADADAFARRRRADAKPFLRLYVVEPTWSLTGANADHRLALQPELVRNVALEIVALLRGQSVPSTLPPPATRFARAVAGDLVANQGRALVMVGPRQPAELHALAHWINAQLGAPIDLIAPIDTNPQSHAEAVKSLAQDIENGAAQTLIVIGANPAYDTPGDLVIADRLASVPFSAHLGLYDDETAAQCQWHLPQSHPLESWSDLRSPDGTASVVQPLIRPLYDSRGAHEMLGLVAGQVSTSAYDEVRQTWRAQSAADGFDDWWRHALHDGVIANSAAQPVSVGAPQFHELAPATASPGISLVLAPDPAIWDGSFGNNPWLQECPRPFTKEVWANVVELSAADAARLGLRDGDMSQVSHRDRSVQGPVRIRDGQADGVIAATLGYGRSRAGAIGNGIGFDAYRLQPSDAPWHVENVAIVPTGARHPVPTTQLQFRLEGEAEDLFPVLTLSELAQGKPPPDHDFESLPSLLPPPAHDTYAWAMVIDTSACIGCNACVVACQAENNIPIVGPEQMLAGRDMHWMRIDTYVPGPNMPPGFQPVPCMHCEQAPCEPVCPVAASVHDAEGLNVQVYNRCIGTRFCQANCPYKVRRFNWFGYADGQEYADLGQDSIRAAHNPDVTVRARGVMEKCTYCVQRISRARRNSEKQDRPIADGEVITACQSACPTRAIHFGDRNDPAAHVNALRAAPHHYALLGHLGTRPRTTYLARLRNPNPALTEPQG